MLIRISRLVTLFLISGWTIALHAEPPGPSDRARDIFINQFATGQYAALEQAAEDARKNGTRLPDGTAVLEPFYKALEPDCGCDDDPKKKFDEWVARVEAWRRAFPKSTTVELLGGKMLRERAWQIRGYGYAGSVTEEGWKGFKVAMEKAARAYGAMSPAAKADPSWYVDMLAIANFQGWPEKDYLGLFEEAVKKYPEYWKIYQQGVFYYAPQWHGSKEAENAFMKYAADLQPGKAGDMALVRELWRHGSEREPFMRENWQRAKSGYDYLIEKYPDPWPVYHYIGVACYVGDWRRALKIYNEKARDNPAVKAYAVDNHDWTRCIELAELNAKVPLPPGSPPLPPP